MQSKFTSLLHGELSDEDARDVLSRLEPSSVSAAEFGQLIEEMLATANPEFKSLEQYSDQSLDCCGTGGSGLPRFNTSTAVSFVLSAAGVKVAKFGNRAASSKSGSFDVLEQLGIPVQVSASTAHRLLDECNIVFLFAPSVYPSLARLAAIRKSLNKKTVFNFTGPLLNPVRPQRRLLGVSDPHMMKSVAAVLEQQLPTQLACIVRANCGLDELCHECDANLHVIGSDAVTRELRKLPPVPASVRPLSEPPGEPPSAQENARLMLELFDGAATCSTAYELVCLNAAAGLLVAGRCSNATEALTLVKELLASGKVKQSFRSVVRCYEKYAN
jgi:anthranilate phosphoribosyltransferase